MKRYVAFGLVLFLSLNVFAREKHIITSDGVDLYVNVKGSGIPCLYVHGGPGAGSYFLEKLDGDYLEKHFQMIYLDQRGAGLSGSPKDNNYSMDRMIEDFEEVREYLGIEKWITLGHSFGGVFQMGYVRKYPEAVTGMIMINCTLNVFDSFNNSWIPKGCEFLELSDTKFFTDESNPINKRLDSLITLLVKKDIIWKMSFSSKKENEEMNMIFRGRLRGNNDQFKYILSIDEYYNDFTKETGDVNIPVLFYYSEKDWCVGPEQFKQVHFPNMLQWKTEGEHMTPFVTKKAEFEKAVDGYIDKYSIK